MRLPHFFRRRPAGRPRFGEDEERRGFTMVEVVTVALIMGTLVRISMPNFHQALLKARAAEVAGDFEVVRVAVLNYHAKYLRWPDDAYTGQIPTGLAEFLPEGFNFNRAGYQLDWENWMLPDGLPQNPQSGVLLGISIVTPDRALGTAVEDLLGGAMAHYELGDKYTFVVERM